MKEDLFRYFNIKGTRNQEMNPVPDIGAVRFVAFQTDVRFASVRFGSLCFRHFGFDLI